MKKGDLVKIKYSEELEEMGLRELTRRKGLVTDLVFNDRGKCRGVYLIPRTGKFKNEEWYIPIQSIESSDTIDALRTVEIIKKVIL